MYREGVAIQSNITSLGVALSYPRVLGRSQQQEHTVRLYVRKWIDCITRKNRLKRNVRPGRLNIWLSRALFGDWRLWLQWPVLSVLYAVVCSAARAVVEVGRGPPLPPWTRSTDTLTRQRPRPHWAGNAAWSGTVAAAAATIITLHITSLVINMFITC